MAPTSLSRFTTLAAAVGCFGGLTFTARPASANVEVGLTGGLHVFSKNNELGVADSSTATSLNHAPLFGLRLGYYFSDILGVEGEAGVIPTSTREGDVSVTAATFRLHLIAQFGASKPERKLIPFVLLGGGSVNLLSLDPPMEEQDVITKDGDEILYLGAGVKYRIGKMWGVRLDARAVFPPSSGSEFATVDQEYLLSVYAELGREELEKIVVIEEPPPPEVGDADGDGLKDDVDQCVQEPEDADGFEDTDGCPDVDNDGDGVPDTTDDCDAEPEDKDQFSDEDGCPDPDNDGDGLADGNDQCPNDPEDMDSFKDDDGCPDPDNDGDGVLDGADQCPDTLETANGFQDEDGCPDELPKAVKQYTGVIKGINFKVNSDVITKSSFKTLNAAVKVLTEYPDLKVEIGGHTDDTGDDAYNQDLSQRRADSVKNYFVGKGIAEDRLTAVGYGKSQPVDERATKAARAKNRRVEFKLVSGLTTAPPAEPAPAPAPEPAPAPTP
jgi:OOP family OmpA-OmpF porin